MIVTFKSTPQFYFAEKDGRKPNTVRLFDATDERFKALRKYEAKYIQVVLVKDGELVANESFVREVTHYCEWEGTAIISWKHTDNDSYTKVREQ